MRGAGTLVALAALLTAGCAERRAGGAAEGRLPTPGPSVGIASADGVGAAVGAAPMGAAAGLPSSAGIPRPPAPDPPDLPLEARLRRVADRLGGRVGVAVLLEGAPFALLDGEGRYPMMSVVKLHQALAVADALARRGQTLEVPVRVAREELLPNTHSPLRDEHPEGGVFTVGELLAYTLQRSDNNACDILFARFGGPAATAAYVRSLGIGGVAVEVTEDEMHRDPESAPRRNWSTPLAAAHVADLLVARPGLLPESFRHRLVALLTTCRTGRNRLPKPLLATSAVVGHKTGTGDRDAAGRQMGINDVGFVRLPDGRRYALAVFVTGTEASLEACEAVIAEISAMVYEAVVGVPPARSGNGVRTP